MEGDYLFESIGLSLALTVLIFSLAVSVTNAYYPGPDYDDEFAGDWWHGIKGYVQGWYVTNNPWFYKDTWHRADRFAIWPNIFVSNLKFWFLGSTYYYSNEVEGTAFEVYFINFYPQWAKTRVEATFHNVITKATWTHSVEAVIVASP